MRGPSKKRSAAVLVATAASALVAAAPAAAAPDYTTTLNASTLEYKWSGGTGKTGFVVLTPSDVPCKTPGVHECDHILVHTEDAGGLKFTTAAADPLAADVDLTLYKSDASGAPGSEIGRGAQGTPTSDETVSTNAVAGGYYLLEVDMAVYAGGTYNGVATFKPKAAAPPTAGPGPAADAAPAVGIQRFKSSQKASKLKGFAGNASDDQGIAKVELAVVRKQGKKCTELRNTKGKFAKSSCKAPKFRLAASGTTEWSLKLRKKLKKGSYVLYARAVDTAGQKSAVASQKFRLK